MLVLVDVKPASGAYVILVEPWFDALDVEMMLARQEEDLVAPHIGLQTDCAHTVGVLLDHRFNGDLP